MSLKRYAAPLRLDFQPSRYLAGGIIALHVGAIVIVMVGLPIALMIKLITTLGVVASLWRFIHVVMLQRAPTSIISLTWELSGEWWLLQRDGKRLSATLLPNSFVHPYLTVLNFRVTQQWFKKSIAILPDMLQADLFRHLRVRLKLEGLPLEE